MSSISPSNFAIAMVRQLLVADTDVVAAVGNRVYSEFAPSDAPTPFILLKHELGGVQNTTQLQNFDGEILVRAVSMNQGEWIGMINKIHAALHDKMPTVITVDSNTKATPYARLEEIPLPSNMVRNHNNTVVYTSGFYYRVRFMFC